MATVETNHETMAGKRRTRSLNDLSQINLNLILIVFNDIYLYINLFILLRHDMVAEKGKAGSSNGASQLYTSPT